MKKLRRRLAIGAVTAAAAFSLAACRQNSNEAVYGPPEDFSQEEPVGNEEGQEDQEIPEEEWTAEYNQNEDVYGPPPEYEYDSAQEEDDTVDPEEDGDSAQEEDGDSEDDWRPEYNNDQAMYGVKWDDFRQF